MVSVLRSDFVEKLYLIGVMGAVNYFPLGFQLMMLCLRKTAEIS